MKCEYCGEKCQSNQKFCKNCGTKLNHVECKNNTSVTETKLAKETSKHSSKSNMTSIIKKLALVIGIVIILALIGMKFFSATQYELLEDYVSVFSQEDSTVFFWNNESIVEFDETISRKKLSLDASKVGILTEDYTLWIITKEGKTMVADDVIEYNISDSGNGIAYLSDYDIEARVASLYLYDCKSNNSRKITDEAYRIRDNNNLTISPDGKTVTYISDMDREAGEFTSSISISGKTSKALDENTYCIATSDKGEYIYYLKLDLEDEIGEFYVKKGKTETKLLSNLEEWYYSDFITLNKDYSQILFGYKDKAYISKNGKEREKLYKSYIENYILPQNTQSKYNLDSFDFFSIRVLAVKDFEDMVVTADDDLLYIDNKHEVSKMTSDSKAAKISYNGKELVYLDYLGNINRITKLYDFENEEENISIGEDLDAKTFVMSSDSSKIYFVNDDDELWFVKGNSKPKKIADNVEESSLCINKKGDIAFFIVDFSSGGGTLYYSKNGRKKTRVKGADVDDVTNVCSNPSGVMYYSNYSSHDDTKDVYYSDGGKTFTKVLEEIH